MHPFEKGSGVHSTLNYHSSKIVYRRIFINVKLLMRLSGTMTVNLLLARIYVQQGGGVRYAPDNGNGTRPMRIFSRYYIFLKY